MPKNFLRSNEIDMGGYTYTAGNDGETVYDRLHNNYRIRHSARRIAREHVELKTTEERELAVHCTFTPNIAHDTYVEIPFGTEKEVVVQEGADGGEEVAMNEGDGYGIDDEDDAAAAEAHDHDRHSLAAAARLRRAAERMPWESTGASYYGENEDEARAQARASARLAAVPRHAAARSEKKAAAAAAKHAKQMQAARKTKGGEQAVHGFDQTVERLRSAQKKKRDERDAYENLGRSTEAMWQKVGRVEQSTEQSRAEQSRAEQGRAEQGRAGQSRAEQGRAGQGRAEQSRAQSTAKPGNAAQADAHARRCAPMHILSLQPLLTHSPLSAAHSTTGATRL